MRIRPDERQCIVDICSEEIEEARRRISERLSQLESRSPANADMKFEGVRRFYEDLVDNTWTEADEQALNSIAEMGEAEIKAIMREAYRRSRMHPVPNFSYLLNLLKKDNGENHFEPESLRTNPDAISAAERERLANLLDNALKEASDEIASRLKLSDAKAAIIREQLEVAQGNIIGRFTPLV